MPVPTAVTKNVATNTALVAAGSLVAGVTYATLIERNAFVVREVDARAHPWFIAPAGAAPE